MGHLSFFGILKNFKNVRYYLPLVYNPVLNNVKVYRGCVVENGVEVEVAVKVVHPGLRDLLNKVKIHSKLLSFISWSSL